MMTASGRGSARPHPELAVALDELVVARRRLLGNASRRWRVDALGATPISLGGFLFLVAERPFWLVDELADDLFAGRVLAGERQAGLITQGFTPLIVGMHSTPPCRSNWRQDAYRPRQCGSAHVLGGML